MENPRLNDLFAEAFGKSIETLDGVNVSTRRMETIYENVGYVLRCITDRDFDDTNAYIFMPIVEMFVQIRNVCAHFTIKPDCNLHSTGDTDGNEKTGFVKFVRDCKKWSSTFPQVLKRKDHLRIVFGYRLPQFFLNPEKNFDFDIYDRYLKDNLILEDAFRLENKPVLVKQIYLIVKKMCQHTCKCDSTKTQPYVVFFLTLQKLLISDM
ncbi:MAG: hypothetical protein K0U78_14285 [Actinomycetia bacterium]|nr:hypothetical protein [Actinomycetes bacterium]